ncbi:hypothetical protein EJ05DRAFT_505013 [Pseudovirgaria hyperparasitica]|uniref:Uncharacterized protein n=1 Tax=Pseudovirgaria hyperparasitica TaxID=470096 RepID=A0A6A6VVV1_9PEZI|nr:uncharacterized protein EJ05DRAFT_505013 [Pseudovirgaria hyperparasitica]KAF2753371.1 hypothetical protein EJ05DRAFT_505013 [Pseudovirgaria hyperparasitica]
MSTNTNNINTTAGASAPGTHSTGASQTGGNIGQAIKEGATKIHGLGEAIRGNFNQAVDGAFNEQEGVTKNAGIAAKGVDEVEDGKYRGYPESKPKNI